MKTHTIIISTMMMLLVASFASATVDLESRIQHALRYLPSVSGGADGGDDIDNWGTAGTDALLNISGFYGSPNIFYWQTGQYGESNGLPRGTFGQLGNDTPDTMCMWLNNWQTGANNRIIEKIPNYGQLKWWPYRVFYSNGNITVNWLLNNLNWEGVTGHDFTGQGWHRICITIDRNTGYNTTSLYEDGVFVASVNMTSSWRTQGASCCDDFRYHVGDAYSTPQNFSIQDLVSYDRILTDEELAAGQLYKLTANTPRFELIPPPQVTWVSPSNGSTFTGSTTFNYSVDTADACIFKKNGLAVTIHLTVSGADSFNYTPAYNSTETSQFSVNCTNAFGSNETEERIETFNTSLIVVQVYWDGQEPKDLDKYSSSQTFYFNASQESNCTLFANDAANTTVLNVPAFTNEGATYTIVAPHVETSPFRIECTNVNGTGSSSTKTVTFDTENPLSCPEGCQPVTDNSTIIDRGVANISVYLECLNTHLQQMNYSIGNSTATLATASIAVNTSEYNVSFTLDASVLANGQYDVSLSCFESPKVAREQYYFTVTCSESWSCTDWNIQCDDIHPYAQSRTCTDSHACGTIVSKPAEAHTCENFATGGLPFEQRYAPPTRASGVFNVLQESGRGLYKFLDAVKMPLINLVLPVLFIGAIVTILFSMGSLIKSSIQVKK